MQSCGSYGDMLLIFWSIFFIIILQIGVLFSVGIGVGKGFWIEIALLVVTSLCQSSIYDNTIP